MDILKKLSYIILIIEDDLKLHVFPTKIYLEAAYYGAIGRKLDLSNPKAFTEKLQWMKIYDRNPLYPIVSDKYEAKRFVEERAGAQFVVPALGVWTQTEDIDVTGLPDRFVLKATHDCGSVLVCDKSNPNLKNEIKSLDKYLKRNFYFVTREWAYKNVQHRIIAEPYLADSSGELRDYKFFCFDGKVQFFKVDFDRFTNHRANYYDVSGRYLDFGEENYPRDPERDISDVHNLKEMVEVAETLSAGFPFLRVDMYNLDGRILIGEFAVYPGAGLLRYTPDEWDFKIGDMLKLPDRSTDKK